MCSKIMALVEQEKSLVEVVCVGSRTLLGDGLAMRVELARRTRNSRKLEPTL